MHIYRHPPAAKVKSLLSACQLPSADLRADRLEHFFGCGTQSEPKGVIGIELYGDVALLRSLAVDEAARHRGCGKRLVAEAEQHARENGVKSLYLLTTTAAEFFRALGYARIERNAVPDVIRATPEFSDLCPSAAIAMVKHVGT